MSSSHDHASGNVAPASWNRDAPAVDGDRAARPDAPPSGADPLSDVLRNVKLSGALFFVVDASTPWCVDVPHTDLSLIHI